MGVRGRAPSSLVWLPILAALAMSVGWGFRGDYGHEAGAMVPGALLALSVCVTARRADWWERASLLAMLGAVGWAFGGQMSYAKIVGYTAHTSFPDVAYGYACLFLIGALWSGIGAGILALGITRPRTELQSFAGPLIACYIVWKCCEWAGATSYLPRQWPANHTSWVTATAALAVAAIYALVVPRARPACRLILLLAGGWWLGCGLLTLLLGLRMTPPRGDNWAGCVGLCAALIVHLARAKNHVALMLMLYGLLAGGIGFAVADLVGILGRAQWGPVGCYLALHDLDYWKWMEQLFGFLMGLGVALGFVRVIRGRLAPAPEAPSPGILRAVPLLFLLVVMMWENLFKNVRNWNEHGNLREGLFGLSARDWFLVVGLLLTATVVLGISRYSRDVLPLAPASALGRAQLLFLLILWVTVAAAFTQAFPGMDRKGVLLVHTTFWLTAGLCSLIVLALPAAPTAPPQPIVLPEDGSWLPGWKYWVLVALMPVLILVLAWLSVGAHAEPLAGSHLRF
jgi:hypothetical protein